MKPQAIFCSQLAKQYSFCRPLLGGGMPDVQEDDVQTALVVSAEKFQAREFRKAWNKTDIDSELP